jgi:hypothetical protein
VFPGVFQSSISYVTSSYQSVDVFTVVGVGSNLPPRLNMPVAPGTLLKYVLETGNPLFMPSTQDFVGPFSDVQFLAMALRLQSLAVLPLLYQGAELVGVLLLGYDVPSTWIEQDTVRPPLQAPTITVHLTSVTRAMLSSAGRAHLRVVFGGAVGTSAPEQCITPSPNMLGFSCLGRSQPAWPALEAPLNQRTHRWVLGCYLVAGSHDVGATLAAAICHRARAWRLTVVTLAAGAGAPAVDGAGACKHAHEHGRWLRCHAAAMVHEAGGPRCV